MQVMQFHAHHQRAEQWSSYHTIRPDTLADVRPPYGSGRILKMFIGYIPTDNVSFAHINYQHKYKKVFKISSSQLKLQIWHQSKESC